MHYERGQEICSTNSPLKDTFDIDKVNISSDSAGSACFNMTRIAGSLLYRMVVQFVDARSGKNITRVLVFDDAEIVCIDGVPPTSTGSTLTGTTSTGYYMNRWYTNRRHCQHTAVYIPYLTVKTPGSNKRLVAN